MSHDEIDDQFDDEAETDDALGYDEGSMDDDAFRVDGVTDDRAADADDERSAELQDVRFGTSWTVDGTTESGNAVEWSTSYNGYFDQKTGEQVEPK